MHVSKEAQKPIGVRDPDRQDGEEVRIVRNGTLLSKQGTRHREEVEFQALGYSERSWRHDERHGGGHTSICEPRNCCRPQKSTCGSQVLRWHTPSLRASQGAQTTNKNDRSGIFKHQSCIGTIFTRVNNEATFPFVREYFVIEQCIILIYHLDSGLRNTWCTLFADK